MQCSIGKSFPRLALSLVSLVFCGTAVAQVPGSSYDEQIYNLKATVEDRAQLSRGEVPTNGADNSQSQVPTLSGAASAFSDLPMPNLSGWVDANNTALTKQLPGFDPTQNPGASKHNNQSMAPESAFPDDSKIIEYGVDWNPWIDKLVKRWLKYLKVLEDNSPYNFHTSADALIHFTCYPNGTIDSISFQRSCGVPLYDQMQVQTLLQCQPLPPFPKGTKRIKFSLNMGWGNQHTSVHESVFDPHNFHPSSTQEKVQQWGP